MLEIKCPKCGIVRLNSNVPMKLNPPECYWCLQGEKQPKITVLKSSIEIKDSEHDR